MKNQKSSQKRKSNKRSKASARAKSGRKKTGAGMGLTLMAVAEEPKRGASKSRPSVSLQNMRIADFYRPLKKPITVRIDADVLAWFKKDGKRYQSRINQALRKVMEKEIKESGI